jgi:predicted DNA-binding ribbon-helix-helix protein
MQTGIINSRWLGMTRGGRMDAAFWLKVMEAAKTREIDTADNDAMQRLITEIEETL